MHRVSRAFVALWVDDIMIHSYGLSTKVMGLLILSSSVLRESQF